MPFRSLSQNTRVRDRVYLSEIPILISRVTEEMSGIFFPANKKFIKIIAKSIKNIKNAIF